MPRRSAYEFQAVARTMAVNLKSHAEEVVKARLVAFASEAIERQNSIARGNGELTPLHRIIMTNRGLKVEFDYIREVVRTGLQMIVQASPRQTGAYRENFAIYVNGVQVENLGSIAFGNTVWIVNKSDYSRRLEIGRTKTGQPFVLRDDQYRFTERTALMKLGPKWGSNSKISFDYVTLGDGYRIKGEHGLTGAYIDKHGKRRKRYPRKDRSQGAQMTYPAIIIEPKEGLYAGGVTSYQGQTRK